jgi:hypothetical protein
MAKLTVQPLPHSWYIDDWPPYVVPGTPSRARHLVRMYQAELVACGALVRIGRRKTVLGAGYAIFLAKGASRVEGFEIAPNRKATASAGT